MDLNNDLFLESILNIDHKVYGKKLRPLSLFHLSLLERFNNPLVAGGPITEKDIQNAALICSSFNLQDFNKKSKSLWNYLLFRFNPKVELSKWEAYWSDYMSFPESVEDDREGKTNPFPFSLMFLSSCIKKGSIKDWEYVFYSMPVGLITWINSSLAFIESGETNVMGDVDRQAIAAIRMTKE